VLPCKPLPRFLPPVTTAAQPPVTTTAQFTFNPQAHTVTTNINKHTPTRTSKHPHRPLSVFTFVAFFTLLFLFFNALVRVGSGVDFHGALLLIATARPCPQANFLDPVGSLHHFCAPQSHALSLTTTCRRRAVYRALYSPKHMYKRRSKREHIFSSGLDLALKLHACALTQQCACRVRK
jgi:hypothetical protein